MAEEKALESRVIERRLINSNCEAVYYACNFQVNGWARDTIQLPDNTFMAHAWSYEAGPHIGTAAVNTLSVNYDSQTHQLRIEFEVVRGPHTGGIWIVHAVVRYF